MNTVKGIIILVTGGLILYLFLFFDFWACPFKTFIHLECPACGMTRAFRVLLHFDIVGSLKFNLLAIPLLIITIYFSVLLIYTIIKNSDFFFKKTDYLLAKYSKIIITVLIINMVINNLKSN